ncbi:DEAD/DEAH box helicase family protein [Candidatus Desantisbacteria bacterium]|nr:DEAD/DEAH box helicase family protein [Candidatus Desantisbacteria bacterium]
MINYKTGQRFISEMEPELGLGIIKEIDERFVLIHFPQSDCKRKFAISSSPLKRVEFMAGDIVKSRTGVSFQVTSIHSHDGIIIYYGNNNKLPENELSDNISFSTPEGRLISGFIDNNKDFNLRYKTLINRYNSKKSSIRGFIGGRIDLIPHQIYVSHEISSRHIPRVLLSDETGLGKTIEACLVVHRLLLSERICRVLILVPDSLVHQWFIELMRRFNLIFRIFDKEHCESIELSDNTANPFLEDQLGLCNIDFLTSNPKWGKKAIEAQWDMLIIDEAHHLTVKSPMYNMAEELSRASKGLMLLTATPEQLGHLSHFSL